MNAGRLAVALLVLVTMTGCGIRRGSTPTSLLVIALESAKPGAVGCFGDPRARTPLWDRLARRGAQFRLEGAADRDRVRSLLTGDHSGPTLAEALSKTSAVSAAFLEPGMPAGSDLRRGFARVEDGSSAASPLARLASSWVRSLDEGTPYFLFLSTGAPNGLAASADRDVDRLLRELGEDRRLERAMIVLVGEGDATAEEGPLPLVLYGPMPFRGGLVRTDIAHRVDLYPTILDAFRHGPDYRLEGRALQKKPSTSRYR